MHYVAASRAKAPTADVRNAVAAVASGHKTELAQVLGLEAQQRQSCEGSCSFDGFGRIVDPFLTDVV